jgi:hypothetical protein
MALPNDTAMLLAFLTPAADPENDDYFRVSSRAGVVSIDYWNTGLLGVQPTELEITNASNDLTPVDHGEGPVLWSAWIAERGGDPSLTTRKKAKDEVVDHWAELGVAMRAELGERNTRDNYATTRLLELQTAIVALAAAITGSNGGAENIRAAVALVDLTFSPTMTRTRAQARNDLKAEIDDK